MNSKSLRTEAVCSRARRRVFNRNSPALRDRMPRRYLELEEQRLTAWSPSGWTTNPPASHSKSPRPKSSAPSIAGLTFDLRLDRIDRLNDGSLLVIDYKSGDVSPKSWELPRPDDVQLPLYAGFALDGEKRLGGLVFAKVRPGDQMDLPATSAIPRPLSSPASKAAALVKNKLDRRAADRLARATSSSSPATSSPAAPRSTRASIPRPASAAACKPSAAFRKTGCADDEDETEAGDEEGSDE
jgi:hypothetical protein